MLRLMRQCASVEPSETLGPEWFKANEAYDFVTRHAHLEFIAKVVKRAIGQPEPVWRPALPPAPPASAVHAVVTLRGMEHYFAQFDRFVETADGECFRSPDALLAAYEGSKACPVSRFCDFLPHGRAARLDVTRARYQRFFTC